FYVFRLVVWNTHGECENVAVFRGHKGAVTELCFTFEGERMLTSSVDKTVGLWDYETGVRVRNFKGHTNYVNACAISGRGTQLGVSASDDGTLKIWDLRSKQLANSFENAFAVFLKFYIIRIWLVVSIVLGIKSFLEVWDIRAAKISFIVCGHSDSVTGIKITTDDSYFGCGIFIPIVKAIVV
ncbi:hypothetical protein MXB_4039, partial [Myxobolus squamalis]